MNVSVLADPGLRQEVEELAQKIAGPDATAMMIDIARSVAEAQIDMCRMRRIRHELLSRAEPETEVGDPAPIFPYSTRLLTCLERYERRALSRRKFAIRAFDLACRSGARDGQDAR